MLGLLLLLQLMGMQRLRPLLEINTTNLHGPELIFVFGITFAHQPSEQVHSTHLSLAVNCLVQPRASAHPYL